MATNKKIMNPVLPSPWMSFAPLGCNRSSQRTLQRWREKHLLKNVKVISQKIEESKAERQPIHEESLFRNLNRNTLILTFPGVSVRKIDTTLVICNNNLSAAINILKDSMPYTNDQSNRFIPPRAHAPPSQDNMLQPIHKTKKEITYIPTKYKDVQIVEVNNCASNVRVLRVPRVTQIVPLLPRILPKTYPTSPEPSQDSMRTFTMQANSLRSSQLLEEQSVENSRDKPQQKSLSPNQILERALTFYPPHSQDN